MGILCVFLWIFVPILASLIRTSSICLPSRRLSEPKTATMNYFISGFWSQPDVAFAFLDESAHKPTAENPDRVTPIGSDLRHVPAFKDEGITLLPYSIFGVSYLAMKKWIERDIRRHGYKKVRIFAVSVATVITRYLDPHDFPDVDFEFFEINPGSSCDFMTREFKNPKKMRERTLLIVLSYLLGPISFIPFIHQSHEWFSARLTADQFCHGAFRYKITSRELHSIKAPNLERKVVLSVEDEIMNNYIIEHFYECDTIAWVHANHGNTLNKGRRFYEAVQALF